MTYAIRDATLRDLNVLSALSTATFLETFGHLYAPDDLNTFLEETYDIDIVREELEDSNLRHLLVDVDGTAAGYARFGTCKLPIEKTPAPAMELHRLYVSKSYHGRGLGTVLIDKVIAEARSQSARSLFLGVWEGNARAQKFYANHGFKEVGEYLFYVGNHADRELILRKLL